MKKFLVLLLVALFCVVSSNAFASADKKGTYSIDSVTVTPPGGGAVWDGGNPADLEVGTTYSVDIDVSYDRDASDDDRYSNQIYSRITFNNSGSYFDSDYAYATNKVYSDGSYESAEYELLYSIEVTEAMLVDTEATADLWRTSRDKVGSTGPLPVNVSEPVPEPSTILLLGIGLLGLVGVSRRKKKA